MTVKLPIGIWVSLVLCFFGAPIAAVGQYGAEVVSYDQGSTPAVGFLGPYTNPQAALGEPERITGEPDFPSIVTPIGGPFLPTEIVSVGEGGQITVKFSHLVLPQAGPEIGVFENLFFHYDFNSGLVDTPFGIEGADSALVEVSRNGVHWESLGNVLFDRPTNGYTDLSDPFASGPGSTLSDFQQPFVAPDLSISAGRAYSHPSNPDVLDLLAGSGGGTWLDISGTGLTHVAYIRFSVPDDLNAGTSLNFELDAVSIAHGAVGSLVPEPGTITLGCLLFVSMANLRHRRSRVVRA
jgi:hypothetical protein